MTQQHKHDEKKLPKWAQRLITRLRNPPHDIIEQQWVELLPDRPSKYVSQWGSRHSRIIDTRPLSELGKHGWSVKSISWNQQTFVDSNIRFYMCLLERIVVRGGQTH